MSDGLLSTIPYNRSRGFMGFLSFYGFIYFSPQPSAAIKIKDGGHNIRYEITEHSLAKITPALQAIALVVTKIHSSSHGNQVDNQTWFDATLV